ncbi:MAG: site-specific integrase, partial [Acidobacteriota bacterium]
EHGATGRIFFQQANTKSGKSRQVPMTPDLQAAMREHLAIRHLHGAGRDWLFTYCGKRLGDIRTGFYRTRDRAGLGRDVHIHTLRHTFATWFMQARGDLWQLMNLLGHQDIKMTMKYAHHHPDHQAGAVAHMGTQPGQKMTDAHIISCPNVVPISEQARKTTT